MSSGERGIGEECYVNGWEKNKFFPFQSMPCPNQPIPHKFRRTFLYIKKKNILSLQLFNYLFTTQNTYDNYIFILGQV